MILLGHIYQQLCTLSSETVVVYIDQERQENLINYVTYFVNNTLKCFLIFIFLIIF